jgi:uncharacterized membrane-anchored protein YitT (DUF2179 family)
LIDNSDLKKHSLFEDVQGFLAGTVFVALGVLLFKQGGLLTGGTTGFSFLIHYPTHWPLGRVLFVVNLPFYVFAWMAMGRSFTLKTFIAVGLLSLLIEWLPAWIAFERVEPIFGAILAGLLAGSGILILVRHGASLGGVTVLGVYLQKRFELRAGMVQMAVDGAILAAAFLVLDPVRALLSLLGAVVVNLVIGINHRTGRYVAI